MNATLKRHLKAMALSFGIYGAIGLYLFGLYVAATITLSLTVFILGTVIVDRWRKKKERKLW